MGCEYFECEECKECNCDFAICSFCENKTYKCLYCVEEMHHLIYNVIFYSEVNDKYGNLNYKFICDDCISIDINDLYKNIKDEELLKLKETILNKKKDFLKEIKQRITIELNIKLLEIQKLQNKLEELKDI